MSCCQRQDIPTYVWKVNQKTGALISRWHLRANQWEKGMSTKSDVSLFILFYGKKVEESLFFSADVADMQTTPSFIPNVAQLDFLHSLVLLLLLLASGLWFSWCTNRNQRRMPPSYFVSYDRCCSSCHGSHLDPSTAAFVCNGNSIFNFTHGVCNQPPTSLNLRPEVRQTTGVALKNQMNN